MKQQRMQWQWPPSPLLIASLLQIIKCISLQRWLELQSKLKITPLRTLCKSKSRPWWIINPFEYLSEWTRTLRSHRLFSRSPKSVKSISRGEVTYATLSCACIHRTRGLSEASSIRKIVWHSIRYRIMRSKLSKYWLKRAETLLGSSIWRIRNWLSRSRAHICRACLKKKQLRKQGYLYLQWLIKRKNQLWILIRINTLGKNLINAACLIATTWSLRDIKNSKITITSLMRYLQWLTTDDLWRKPIPFSVLINRS